jgi:hypothetical protein
MPLAPARAQAPPPLSDHFPERHTPAPPAGPVNGAGEDSAAIMTRHYCSAINIALEAVKCAEAKGLRITPAFEDIRAMAATLLINESGRR